MRMLLTMLLVLWVVSCGPRPIPYEPLSVPIPKQQEVKPEVTPPKPVTIMDKLGRLQGQLEWVQKRIPQENK